MRHAFLIGCLPTATMKSILSQKSIILCIRIFDELQAGDNVVFEKDGTLLVKRITAGPGDKVDLSQLSYVTTVPIPEWGEPVLTVPKVRKSVTLSWEITRITPLIPGIGLIPMLGPKRLLQDY